jgi:hypothetical protein
MNTDQKNKVVIRFIFVNGNNRSLTHALEAASLNLDVSEFKVGVLQT